MVRYDSNHFFTMDLLRPAFTNYAILYHPRDNDLIEPPMSIC